MTLPVTGLAAAICALLLIYCAYATVRQRLASQIGFGDGDNPDLLTARRIHANLSEHAPIFLIMLGVLELANAHHFGLTTITALFLVGRVAVCNHACLGREGDQRSFPVAGIAEAAI